MAVDTHSSTISTLQAEVDNFILDLYPRQGEWTEEEYLDLTDHTNHLIEFTDGYVEVLLQTPACSDGPTSSCSWTPLRRARLGIFYIEEAP